LCATVPGLDADDIGIAGLATTVVAFESVETLSLAERVLDSDREVGTFFPPDGRTTASSAGLLESWTVTRANTGPRIFDRFGGSGRPRLPALLVLLTSLRPSLKMGWRAID
jgi:hypothetical protein